MCSSDLAGIDASQVKAVVESDDKGYTMVVEIPMQTIQLKDVKKVGFDIQINDFNYTLKWNDSSTFTNQDLSRIGTLRVR